MDAPIGQLITAYRRRKRQEYTGRPWTQEDLAVAIGTEKAHVSRIECGRQVPARTTLLRICRALDIQWDEEQALLVAAGHGLDLRLPTGEELEAVLAWAGPLVDSLPRPALLFDLTGRFWHGNPVGLRFLGSAAGMDARALLTVCRGTSVLELLRGNGPALLVRRLVPEDVVLGYVVRFQQVAGLWRHTPEYRAMLARLLENAEFAHIWRQATAAAAETFFAGPLAATVHHPRLGTVRMDLQWSPLQVDGRFVIVHDLPADAAGASALGPVKS